MRLVSFIAMLFLLGTLQGQAGQERVYFTPDEATLACLAQVKQELERRGIDESQPVEPFETAEHPGVWRVRGIVIVQEDSGQQRLKVTCDVRPDRIDVRTSLASE